MTATAIEDIEVGIEEAASCLPSLVLDEAILETNKKKKDDVKYHNHRHRSKLLTEPSPPQSKGGSRRLQKQKYSANWATGGPGMQAFFLNSGRKSCGTGVFLPQTSTAGPNNFRSGKRPACSPVLFPTRVVQALNLNVHELGLQITPRRDPKNNTTTTRGGGSNPFNNKNGKDNVSTTKRCIKDISQNGNSSPDVFLPDEWTY